MPLRVIKQEDFLILPENEKKFACDEWKHLECVGGEKRYRTWFKAVYSDTGLYLLFDCEDQVITCTLQEDGDDLYTEDVLEIFLQPDTRHPVYLV